MGRIHPTEITKPEGQDAGGISLVWTVWKKSSMAFQGTDGFSVYNSEGKLAFRVDNYSRKHKEIILMNGVGKALLYLRPQILSMYDQWNGWKATEEILDSGNKFKMFSMRRSSILNNDDKPAEIFMGSSMRITIPDFRIEGCFWRRSCKIRSKSGDVVAQISRKKVNKSSVILSDDVFSLEISPGIDEELVMAFVVVMDRICYKRYAPLLCS